MHFISLSAYITLHVHGIYDEALLNNLYKRYMFHL